MTYFTGDIHGRPDKIQIFCRRMNLTAEDTIVILGDVGANYYGNDRDEFMKCSLAALAPTILCIHGNHEQRPANIVGYELQQWNGGAVWVQPQYPNLLFAKDGEVYEIDGVRYLVIGGAYSVDKFYRLARGYGWWKDEQPSDEIKAAVEQRVAVGDFDVILSHTCPYRYEPTEMFLTSLDQSTVDISTEEWLNEIEAKADYKAWFCGHWHTDKRVDKLHFLFDTFESSEDLQIETAAKRVLNRYKDALNKLEDET